MADKGDAYAAKMLADMERNGMRPEIARANAIDQPRSESYRLGRDAFDRLEAPARMNAVTGLPLPAQEPDDLAAALARYYGPRE